jgi:hypothetical protein
MYGLGGLISLAFQSINVDVLILKPPNVVEFHYGINYNVGFEELDFFYHFNL